MTSRPTILIVDDDDQRLVVHELQQQGLEAVWRFPTEVSLDDLLAATLIAVDQYLDYDRAPDDDLMLSPDIPETLVPRDGISLAAVFRSAAKYAGRTDPLAIALRSGDLDRLTEDRPRAIRESIIAATHDLEWVLNKVDSNPGSAPYGSRALITLAHALTNFPPSQSRPSVQQCAAWLLPPASPSWAEQAARQIEQCRPPVNAAFQHSHGLAWLRWLAHHCLPFPTFVINDIRAATELGITVASFRQILSTGGATGEQLRQAQYSGPLADLHPRRFWRAALNELVKGLVDPHETDDPQLIGKRLASKDGLAEPLDLVDPVVCIDVDFYDLDQPAERHEARRLSPDYWPAYADAAFARTDALDNDQQLRALLAPRLQA